MCSQFMMHGQKNIKSQILSCDSLVANEQYVVIVECHHMAQHMIANWQLY